MSSQESSEWTPDDEPEAFDTSVEVLHYDGEDERQAIFYETDATWQEADEMWIQAAEQDIVAGEEMQ